MRTLEELNAAQDRLETAARAIANYLGEPARSDVEKALAVPETVAKPKGKGRAASEQV